MHTLIVGMTESGKTALSKMLARGLRKQGKPVAVLDPICDPAWDATYITPDAESFSLFLRGNRSVYAFVDECGEVFNQGNDLTHAWWLTTSRHYGHSITCISVRAMQIPKLMRDQCKRLYLFTSSAGDGKIHAEEWNKPVLERCNTLPRGTCYCVDRYATCDMYTIGGPAWDQIKLEEKPDQIRRKKR